MVFRRGADSALLIVPILQAFVWFADGLENHLREEGWPDVTRPQLMVLMSVVLGVTRPSEIARLLGVSRQAVHTTLTAMVDLGFLRLTADPDDRRSKVVEISGKGVRIRDLARAATEVMVKTLAERIGPGKVAGLRAALAADWGPPLEEFD
jgi:DNA-binding MarR family transcriptional regulator